jgi:hypothetical protein
MENSKETLDKTFGGSVNSFAFPFNDFGQNTVNFPGARDIVLKVVPTVYEFAFYQHWPANGDSFNYPDPSASMIKRIEPHSNWSADDLIATLDAGHAKPLPYSSTHFGKEWVSIWGTVELGDALHLKAQDSGSGASAFLDGSAWWKDYSISTKANWVSGQALGLIARNYNDTDYLVCSFAVDGVTIEKHQGPDVAIIATHPLALTPGTHNLSMTVKDSTATCSVEGTEVVRGSFSGLPRGGVGVEVWSDSHGVAESSYDSIDVQQL